MKKLGIWLKKTWLKIRSRWGDLDDKVKGVAVISVKICEGIKESINSGFFDTVATLVDVAVPGDQAVIFRNLKDYLQKNLPKLILKLNVVVAISGLNDVDAEMKAIIAELAKLKDPEKDKLWQELAGMIVNASVDGAFSKEELKDITDFAYLNFVKSK